MTKYIVKVYLKNNSSDLFRKLTDYGFVIYIYDELTNTVTVLNKNYSDKIIDFDEKAYDRYEYHCLYNGDKFPTTDIINFLESETDLSYIIEKRVI